MLAVLFYHVNEGCHLALFRNKQILYLQENPSNSTQQLRLLLWVILGDSVICLHSKHVVLRGEKADKMVLQGQHLLVALHTQFK